MNQTSPQAPLDVAVVGAGLAGLACAHALQLAGKRVLCLEASDEAGGVVRSLRRDGYLFEAGPNTVQASALAFRQLADDVGLTPRLQVSLPDSGTRYLWHAGKLSPLPHGPGALLATPLLSTSAKLRLLSEPLRKLRGNHAQSPEPSFAKFLTERIGLEATRTFAGAFVRGVYASEVDELGARSGFPRMWDLAFEHGGLVRGMLAKKRAAKHNPETPPPGPTTKRSDLLTFPEGLAELPRALTTRLGSSLRLGSAVDEMQRGPGAWSLRLESEEVVHAKGLVLALPARAAHRLLSMAVPERTDLSALYGVEHASVTVVHLGLQKAQLPPGFGFLVPPDEEGRPGTPKVLGTLFPSCIFAGRAPAGGSTVTSMMRGSDVAGLSDTELAQRAHTELAAAIGLQAAGEITTSLVQHWEEAIPRYTIGHAERMTGLVRSLGHALPGLELAGSYLAGVSVDDTIRSGQRAANAWLASERSGGAA